MAKQFPIKAFIENWKNEIEQAIASSPSGTHIELRAEPGSQPPSRLKILLEYVASPITTGRYFEWALRKEHEVTTAGFRFPEELLDLWGFGPPPVYPSHQVELELNGTYSDLLSRLPQKFEPEILFYVDSGRKGVPPDMDCIGFLKICYLIDTHIAPEIRIDIARNFNFTFLAQRAQVKDFNDAGIDNVFWVPLGCSPELHDIATQERMVDVSYIGRLADDGDERRRRLVKAVCDRVPNHVCGQYYPTEMAEIYGRSKIVINAAVKGDLNMRVFEAMASGALLITDQADGLEDLFEDGTHLVIYRNDDELPDLVERYLADDDDRERIAAAGRTEVLSNHTYAQRINEILTTAFHSLGLLGGVSGESRYQVGGYFRYPRPELVPHIPKSTGRLLDVGCGGGEFGLNLKRRGLREVMGIEVVERACELAKKVLDGAYLGNIEEMDLPFEDGFFDCIVFADVLEHLIEPGKVLEKIKPILSAEGVVVASIPNIRYWCIIDQLAGQGRWPYEDAGILDRTHLRFFTGIEIRGLFEAAGYKILKLQPLSIYDSKQLERNEDGSLTIGRVTIDDVDDAEYMDFLTYQYLVVAGHPGSDRLKSAREAFERDDYEAAYTLAEDEETADPYERHLILGKSISKLGKLDTAETHFRSALKERPDSADVRISLGILLLAMNRATEAKTLIESVDDDLPPTLQARLDGALGLIALAENRPEDAFAHLKASLGEEFSNETVLERAIELARVLERVDEIEPFARRFVDFYPGNIELARRFVELLIEIGNYDEARTRIETLLLFAPDDEDTLRVLDDLQKRCDQ